MGNVIKRRKGTAQNNASIPPVFDQGSCSLPMNQNQVSYENDIFLSNTTGWSINDIERLRVEFTGYANPNGATDRHAFRKLYIASMLNMNLKTIERNAEVAFRSFDVNQTGTLDFNEYIVMSIVDQDDGLEAFRLALANQAPDNSAAKQEKRAELRSRFLNVLEYIKSNKNISPIQLDFHRESSLIAAHCLSIDSNFSQVLVQDLQTFIGHIPTALVHQTIATALKEKTPFVYIDSCLIQSTDEEDEQYDGCSCSLNDTCADCSCSNRFGINYNSLTCLNINKTGPVFECNSECRCSFELCQNRVSQKDDQCNNAEIISTPNKGSGVISRKSILHPGTYIGEYVGEVLSENEARRRILATENYEHNYLLLYNEHQSGKIIKTFIDARYYGNWTRFINHSCNPNLHIVPIRIDQPTPPRLAFFTLREIQGNEELSYSYGTTIDEKHSKPCRCSSSSCTGFMPYQQTD
ncbi:unnamed protein product [Rotaria magnacalcarata]|uniref:Uncharacterized protein n=1 Tax=Rotaria magnacalcarata TaxID=392030 RepID=A0A815LER3_9BILA|nr:unnamed protein product [Rotaria magnacalcarata]